MQQRQTHSHNELEIENIVFIFQSWVFANIETQETWVIIYFFHNNPTQSIDETTRPPKNKNKRKKYVNQNFGSVKIQARKPCVN